MKVLSKEDSLCIKCHKCEEVCSTAFFKESDIKKAALRIKEDAQEILIITCNQCGECIDVCQVQALYRDKNDIVRIKKNICVGCLMCVGFCPELAMFQNDELTEPLKCISCGLCAKECPTGAIHIEER